MPLPDEALTRQAIAEVLNTRWLGRSFYLYEEVDSTNAVLSNLAQEGVSAGTMIITEFQTQGRGRHQRRWEAPPRTSLLLSLLLRPGWPVSAAHWLTMSAGLAVTDVIASRTSLEVGLKWPNDIMIRHTDNGVLQWRKTGGILLETTLENNEVRQAILGIGLNVNLPRQRLPNGVTLATSLLIATGHSFDRAALLAQILQRLEALYETAKSGRSPQPDWDSRLITRNKNVRVVTNEGVVEGLALGSDEWGRLLVRLSGGELKHFAAGDVTLRS